MSPPATHSRRTPAAEGPTADRTKLIELGHSEDEIEATEREVRGTLDRAIEAALAAPYPDPETDGATEFAT